MERVARIQEGSEVAMMRERVVVERWEGKGR